VVKNSLQQLNVLSLPNEKGEQCGGENPKTAAAKSPDDNPKPLAEADRSTDWFGTKSSPVASTISECAYDVPQAATNSTSYVTNYTDEYTPDGVHGKSEQNRSCNERQNELQMVQPKQRDENYSRQCEHANDECTGYLEKLGEHLLACDILVHGLTIRVMCLQIKCRTV